ncbi:hypothetical protein PIROE2DRAFT_7942, partial [Piromyces sp. E2]
TLFDFDITDDLIKDISKLTQLEELIIYLCKDLKDPERKTIDFSSLGKLVNLQVLQISFNRFDFEGINDKIYRMPKLRELYVNI